VGIANGTSIGPSQKNANCHCQSLPVAAFPVAGPLDIVGADGRGPDSDFPARFGALDAHLPAAISKALRMDRRAAAAFAARFNWGLATDQFFAAVAAQATVVEPAELHLV
jgi:hypothetical protein